MPHLLRALLIVVLFSAGCLAGERNELSDELSRLSYSVGYQVGGDFKRQGIDITPKVVLQGVEDAMKGADPALSSQEMRHTLTELQLRLVELQKKKTEEMAEKNLAAGRKFLAENGKRSGVVTLPSGLQYEIITKGAGGSPAATDVVEVNYRGELIDGTEFDSSYKRSGTAQFRVDKVIKGWTDALQRMEEGGRWRLFIPPELAYANRRMGAIEPNSTLVFDIELLSVIRNVKVKEQK